MSVEEMTKKAETMIIDEAVKVATWNAICDMLLKNSREAQIKEAGIKDLLTGAAQKVKGFFGMGDDLVRKESIQKEIEALLNMADPFEQKLKDAKDELIALLSKKLEGAAPLEDITKGISSQEERIKDLEKILGMHKSELGGLQRELDAAASGGVSDLATLLGIGAGTGAAAGLGYGLADIADTSASENVAQDLRDLLASADQSSPEVQTLTDILGQQDQSNWWDSLTGSLSDSLGDIF